MVFTKYAPAEAPFIGKGRWTWQTSSLKNNNLMKKVVERGKHLQEEITHARGADTDRKKTNPQTLWKAFKDDIREAAKKHNSESRAKIAKRKELILGDMIQLTNHPDLNSNNDIRHNEAFLASELAHLEKTQAKDRKDKFNVTLAHHGEVLGGAWSAINKERKPRDLVFRLKTPNSDPPTYERDSRRMAKLARDYHNDLQSDSLTLPTSSLEHVQKLK